MCGNTSKLVNNPEYDRVEEHAFAKLLSQHVSDINRSVFLAADRQMQ